MELSRNTFPADRWCDGGREGMSRKDFFKVECSGLCFSFSYSSPVSNAEMSTEVQLIFLHRNDPPICVFIQTLTFCMVKYCSNSQQYLEFLVKISKFPKIPNKALQTNFGEVFMKMMHLEYFHFVKCGSYKKCFQSKPSFIELLEQDIKSIYACKAFFLASTWQKDIKLADRYTTALY